MWLDESPQGVSIIIDLQRNANYKRTICTDNACSWKRKASTRFLLHLYVEDFFVFLELVGSLFLGDSTFGVLLLDKKEIQTFPKNPYKSKISQNYVHGFFQLQPVVFFAVEFLNRYIFSMNKNLLAPCLRK